jgi:NTE family protein
MVRADGISHERVAPGLNVLRRQLNGDLTVGPGPHPEDRLSIGLVLGGGAARGFAHIGVLRTLAAHGIRPDVIAGTSIGAVVGGLFAAGELDAFEDWCRQLTRRRVLGYLDFRFGGSGLISGSRLASKLEGTIGNTSFADLPLRLAAIATEIGTGHEIWLTRGDAVAAICAAYALPGIFEPVRINGRWLFDGALVNPIPVTLCRALGAEIVVAVNLVSDTTFRGTVIHDPLSIEPTLEKYSFGAPERTLSARIFGGMGGNLRRLFGKREDGAPGIANAMMDAFNIAQGRISRSRLAGDPPDVLINARLGKVGLFDFHRADELIAIGREATRRAFPEIAGDIAALRPENTFAPP